MTGSLKNKKRSGRPRKTTKTEDRYIKILSKKNRRLTAPEIRAELNNSRTDPISVSTVKARLAEANLHGRVAARKPLLRTKNKVKRLEWAKQHRSWTIEDWSKVLWTDESKFEIFGTKRRIYVRQSAEEKMLENCLVPTVKHGGGSVMVWGAFSSSGVGDLIRIEGILNKERYKSILQRNAIPSGQRLIGEGFTLQQDNDPKHTSKVCKSYLDKKERGGVLKNMVWPPQSPDLNPIELLWDELDRRVRETCPTSQSDLWQILKDTWSNIRGETIKKLINRMPRLCEKVISKKGGFFDEKTV